MGNANVDKYRVEIGDTERSLETVISDLEGYGTPIIRVEVAKAASGHTGAGAVLTVGVKPGSVDEASLKSKLNESGGCMYQIASVAKLP